MTRRDFDMFLLGFGVCLLIFQFGFLFIEPDTRARGALNDAALECVPTDADRARGSRDTSRSTPSASAEAALSHGVQK